MTGLQWFKVPTSWFDTAAVVELGAAPTLLVLRMVALSARTGQDGYISDAQIAAMSTRSTPRTLELLAGSGLIERVIDVEKSGGWRVSDPLLHQQSAAKTAEIRETRAKAGGAGGSKRSKQTLELEEKRREEKRREKNPHPHLQPDQVPGLADVMAEAALVEIAETLRTDTERLRPTFEAARRRAWPTELLIAASLHAAVTADKPSPYWARVIANDPPAERLATPDAVAAFLEGAA